MGWCSVAETKNDWATTGIVQNLKGKVLEDFCEEFLKTLPKYAARAVEAESKSLFDMRNFARFRKQYIVALAAMYINGSAAQKSGKEIALLDKIQESATRNASRIKSASGTRT